MVVVDSDILISLLRGDSGITEKFKKAVIATEGNICITPVQTAEIYAGIFPKEKTVVESFLSTLGVITINGQTGKLAGEFLNKYTKSHNVTLADAMVASASRLNGCELWTMNKKHYPMLAEDEFFKE